MGFPGCSIVVSSATVGFRNNNELQSGHMRLSMQKKTKVGLVQINNSFSGQSYLPYSVGILQAYAQQHLSRPDEFEFLLPIYSRIAVDDAVEQLVDADLGGEQQGCRFARAD